MPIASQALEAMAKKVDELPLLPQVLVRLLQLDPNSNGYFDEFERLVLEDPPFAVRVVALANSAANAPISPIVRIKNAMSRLGSDTVRSLVASLAVQRVFVPTEDNQIRLWTHSISVAVASKHLAKLIPNLEVDPEKAYLAGLLHDIGRFVMFEHAPQNLQDVDETKWHSPEELVSADVEVFTYTHAELGYRACKNWGIPNEIATVVRMHHELPDRSTKPQSWEAEVACVRLADRLCIAIFEHPYDEDEVQELITNRVLLSDEEKSWLGADVLASSLSCMRAETDQLLAGMGFA